MVGPRENTEPGNCEPRFGADPTHNLGFPQAAKPAVSETKIRAVAVSGLWGQARERGNKGYPAKPKDFGGVRMITERYEGGKRIISVDTEKELAEALLCLAMPLRARGVI